MKGRRHERLKELCITRLQILQDFKISFFCEGEIRT